MRLPKLAATFVALMLPFASVAAQQKVNIQRAATPNVSVRLNGAIGSIRVMAWEHDSISITGGIGAGSRMDGGPTVGTSAVTGMKFYVEAADEAGARNNKIEMRVPRGARVWIKALSADIEVSGVAGGLDLNIVGGSVTVDGKPRELVIESMDGSVQFRGFADYARIKTATGDINLTAHGADFSVSTISGNITVTPQVEWAYQRARFESVTGAITFAGDIARGGDVRFDSHSGAIDLRLAPRVNSEFDIVTITGTIENNLTNQRPGTSREGRGMELGTSSGTGGARVQVRSFKGNVKLTTR